MSNTSGHFKIVIESTREESQQATGQSITGQLEKQQDARRNSIQDQDDDYSWNPKEVLAAQGLLERAHCSSEFPDLVNQLTLAMLEHGQQIEAEMADDLNKDLIWLCNQQAAACHRSDGDAALCRCT